jgi:hypothetical protein
MVRANALAEPSLRVEGKRQFPVGSVLVKEKYLEPLGGKPVLLTGMIKRSPGFDPKVGDWEFFVVNLGNKIATFRGQDPKCVKCHQAVAEYGHVFTIAGSRPRVWLP